MKIHVQISNSVDVHSLTLFKGKTHIADRTRKQVPTVNSDYAIHTSRRGINLRPVCHFQFDVWLYCSWMIVPFLSVQLQHLLILSLEIHVYDIKRFVFSGHL